MRTLLLSLIMISISLAQEYQIPGLAIPSRQSRTDQRAVVGELTVRASTNTFKSSARLLQQKVAVRFQVIQNQPGLLFPTPAVITSEISLGNIDSPSKLTPKVLVLSEAGTGQDSELKVKSVKFSNTVDLIELLLDDNSPSVSGRMLRVVFTEYPLTEITSNEKIYIYNEPSSRFSWTLGIVIGYLCVVFAGLCMLCGIKQFYHVVRTTQVLSVCAFFTCFKPNTFLNAVQGLQLNLFNIVPFIKVSEQDMVMCQPGLVFYTQGWSCLTYNTLKSYLIEFLIFIIILGFVITNKFQETQFWSRLKSTLSFKNYLLSIWPQLLVAALLNSSVSLSNSSLALGFLFGQLIITSYLFNLYDLGRMYFDPNKHTQLAEYMEPYCFSRTTLTANNPHFGRFVAAVLLDKLKLAVLGIMLGLFGSKATLQLYVGVGAFVLNGIFVLAARPYTEKLQTGCTVLTEALMSAILLILAVVESKSSTNDIFTLHSDYGTILALLIYVTLAVNLLMFVSLILKGTDGSELIPNNQVSPEQRVEIRNDQSANHVLDETGNDTTTNGLKVKSVDPAKQSGESGKKELRVNETTNHLWNSTKPSVSQKLTRMDSEEKIESFGKSMDLSTSPMKTRANEDPDFILPKYDEELKQQSGKLDMKSVDQANTTKVSPRVHRQLLEAETKSPVAQIKPADWD